MTETERAYIAGLFDGEGSVDYAQRWEKRTKGKYKVWRIHCEISMTDEPVIRWLHEVLGVGTVRVIDKTKAPSGKPHYKKQWRWRCSFRDAYSFAKIVWPHVQVKLHKIEQIIDHYTPEDQSHKGENVVNLEDYR